MIYRLSVILWLSVLFPGGCQPEPETKSYQKALAAPAEKEAEGILCRLFFQDHQTRQLRRADVRRANVRGEEKLSLDDVKNVDGFPELDSEKQNLVQMEVAGGTLLVGVRDHDNGAFQSGWVLVNTGVVEEVHGDHAHWHFEPPALIASQLDEHQGNPAHLYVYQGIYYLANDRLNGYTRIDPEIIDHDSETPVTSGFHQGGGNHITLAVAENTTGYGTWIDGGGPNEGRVDVTRIKRSGNTEIAYRFQLPTGGIHGAAVAADKVFFAPSDGLCWVTADLKPEEHSGDVQVHQMTLGKSPETLEPLRTGAFTAYRDHLLFVTGEEDFAALSLVDASQDEPVLIRVRIPMKPGQSPTVPQVVKTVRGQRLAFVFHNQKAELDGEEFLSIVDLDPNSDGSFQDAKLLKTLPAGASAVEGHYGHHEISFDHAGKYAFWTNPGDGTISMFSLKNLQPLAEFNVGGMPTKLIALGEENHAH